MRTATGGQLDLLWANAGTGVARTVPETTLEEWNRVQDFAEGKQGRRAQS